MIQQGVKPRDQHRNPRASYPAVDALSSAHGSCCCSTISTKPPAAISRTVRVGVGAQGHWGIDIRYLTAGVLVGATPKLRTRYGIICTSHTRAWHPCLKKGRPPRLTKRSSKCLHEAGRKVRGVRFAVFSPPAGKQRQPTFGPTPWAFRLERRVEFGVRVMHCEKAAPYTKTLQLNPDEHRRWCCDPAVAMSCYCCCRHRTGRRTGAPPRASSIHLKYHISSAIADSRCDRREGADPPGLEENIMPDHDGAHEQDHAPNHRSPARVTEERRQHFYRCLADAALE